ncbi:MAG: hypothetical protein DMF49_05815 [Acidobacteria bacterium]|nr:MAG: hypothetical protein DMF49_05815 [Acidobacteriota bacterium]
MGREGGRPSNEEPLLRNRSRSFAGGLVFGLYRISGVMLSGARSLLLASFLSIAPAIPLPLLFAATDPVVAPGGSGKQAAAPREDRPKACLDLAGLVPSTGDLPDGWSVAEPGSDRTLDSTTSRGVSLVLASLRRSGIVTAEEADVAIRTPTGGFQAVYALLPPPATAGDPGEILREAVMGSGAAAKSFGRVLLLAATTDREALHVLADKLFEKMAKQLHARTMKADSEGDSSRVVLCMEDFLAADPANAPVHLALAEHLLLRSNPPDLRGALRHFESALDPSAGQALPPSDRWRALLGKGQAQQLLGAASASLQTLRAALAAADGDEQRASIEYTLAASEAALGNKKKAIEALTRSFEASRHTGRPGPASMAGRDASFLTLAGEPAFRQLLEKYSP